MRIKLAVTILFIVLVLIFIAAPRSRHAEYEEVVPYGPLSEPLFPPRPNFLFPTKSSHHSLSPNRANCFPFGHFGLFAELNQLFATAVWYFRVMLNFRSYTLIPRDAANGLETCVTGRTPYFRTKYPQGQSVNALWTNLHYHDDVEPRSLLNSYQCIQLNHYLNSHGIRWFNAFKLLLSQVEENLSKEYLNVSHAVDQKLVGLGLTKPYLAVHIRRSDALKDPQRPTASQWTSADYLRRIQAVLRTVTVSSILVMSDGSSMEDELCSFFSISGEFHLPCIRVTHEFLSPTLDNGEARDYIAKEDEGFLLYKFAQLFGTSEFAMSSFSSNFPKFFQLYRDDPSARFFDFFGFYWTPCWTGRNPLDTENHWIYDTMAYDVSTINDKLSFYRAVIFFLTVLLLACVLTRRDRFSVFFRRFRCF